MYSSLHQQTNFSSTASYLQWPENVVIQQFSLSYETSIIFHWLLYTVLCQTIDLFGIATNIINIACFVKQGFQDPVNISLLGLAISDLGSLASLVWVNISVTPPFMTADLPFDTFEIQYYIGAMTHTHFIRVTGWITALITMERCLCITVPLKVNRIVTTKSTTIAVICVFVLMLGSGAPIYVVNRLDWKFYPERNKSLIGIVSTQDSYDVEKISYAVNNAFIPFSAFFVNVVCTSILVIKLRNSTKFREKSTTALQADIVSNRNQKVAKMVVIISTLFIVCFIPVSIIFMGMSFIPGLSINGEHKFILIITGGFGLIMESINSSVNIFFYYHMSSKYRTVFRKLFCL